MFFSFFFLHVDSCRNPFIPRVNYGHMYCSSHFESVDEILWYDIQVNPLPQYFCTVPFVFQYLQSKFGIFLEVCVVALLGAKGPINKSEIHINWLQKYQQSLQFRL